MGNTLRTIGILAIFGTAGLVFAADTVSVDGASPSALPPLPETAMTLPANQWTRIGDVPPDPLGRELEPGRGAFFCYEPVSGEFLRYGGYTPTDCNALWAFDLKKRRWENRLAVDYAWPPPVDRPGAGAWWSMAQDSKRNVVWFFGGWGLVQRTHADRINDVWRYDPATGAFEAMKAHNVPDSRLDGMPIIYDANNDLIVAAPVARDHRLDRRIQGRTHVYDPNSNAWEVRKTPEMPYNVRNGPNVFVYAPCIGKSVFLENDPEGGPAATWTYDAAENAWAKLDVSENPPSRVVAGSTYDSVNRLVIVYGGVGFGGVGGGSWTGYLNAGSGTLLHDTWALDLSIPAWRKLDAGAPVVPRLPGQTRDRFEIATAMDYDPKHETVVLAAPTMGVWALRYQPEKSNPRPALTLAPLPEFEPPEPPERMYPLPPKNEKLLTLPPNEFVPLGGGIRVGGSEVPHAYDESTGYVISYGGCGSFGTTFSNGYGNPLSAYDPATERWIALRWYDPCGPPRHRNGCNMYIAYDTRRGRSWIWGGTSQNRLAMSRLPDWDGGSVIWSYSGLRDRFDMTAVMEQPRLMNNGVITCYDPENDLFVISPSRRESAFGFNPETGVWREIGPNRAGAGYSYACYVDTLKGMFIMEQGETPCLFDAETGAWTELPSKGEVPRVTGDHPQPNRSATAYSPDDNIVMAIADRKAWLYDVPTGIWTKVGSTPFVRHVVYDKRHKVFLLFPLPHRNVAVHAFRPERR